MPTFTAFQRGVGPSDCHARNPRLVYGRMTGWGREGPLADRAGHDIDYIALAGALSAFGRAGAAPTPPINVLGDFGGGGLLLAYGIACALVEAGRSGRGQVVDTAMVDGTAMLMALPSSVRGIVTGLSITYLKKARGTLTAECRCDVPDIQAETSFDVHTDVRDEAGDVVARATVTWRLAPRTERA